MTADYTDNHDRNLDTSLKAASQFIALPAVATAQQAAIWRSDRPAATLHEPGRQARSPRRWLAGLSAAAATLAVGAAVFFTVTPGSRVQASTILGSLRSATVHGVKITLSDLTAEGATVSGELQVRFAAPVAVEAVFDDRGPEPEPSHIYAKLDVSMGAGSPVPGLSAHVEGALSQESTWVFVQSSEIPINDIPPQQRALAAMIGGFIRNGLMIDLGADALHRLEGLDADAIEDDDDHAAPGHPRAEVKVQVNTDADNDEAADADPHRQDHGLNLGPAVNNSIRSLLTGQAGAAELADIQAMLQEASANATVQDLGHNQYLLTAAGLEGEGRMKVFYSQGAGVQWIEVDQIHDLGGSIRIEMMANPIDSLLLDKARLINAGQTMVVDEAMLRAWGALFGE